ncbi:MAG: peptide deformylase [Alphaproteobacteria bacterium]
MAILKIARMGHPVLARPAAPVPDPGAPEIAALIEDMIATLADIGGRGLAAPQVHVPLRVVIFHAPETGDGELTRLVNPVIEPLGDTMEDGWEGCLSVPGLRGMVPRHARVRYRGVTPEGVAIDRMAEGLHARVVQHECDHLDGILYPMRMTDLGTLVFESELRWFATAAPVATADAEDNAA